MQYVFIFVLLYGLVTKGIFPPLCRYKSLPLRKNKGVGNRWRPELHKRTTHKTSPFLRADLLN